MNIRIRADFSSVDEFCKMPFTLKENEADCRRHFQARDGIWLDNRRQPMQWFGAPSAKVAEERVTKGWAEGAQRVLANMENIEVELPISVRRKLSRADQGDELDIHSVYSGNLDRAWTKRARKHVRSPLTVRIVVQTNLLHSMNPEQLFWRGAAAVKLCDLLVNAGYNVEIVGALASKDIFSRGEDKTTLTTIMLKDSKQPLDIEQLAGVICNAGFHRLFGFRAYYALADFPCMGRHPGESSSDTSGEIIKAGKLDADSVMTFVTPYSVGSKERAKQFVEECCAWLNQPQEMVAT